MAATLSCPRCAGAPPLTNTLGLGATEGLTLDACAACHGTWLDGAEVATAFPGLGRHHQRIGELLGRGGRRGGGIASCPRCGSEPIEFPFLDLRLDLCSACHGLWLDGDEVAAVSRTADHDDGLLVDAPVGGYRHEAAAVVQRRAVRCARCNKDVELTKTTVTCGGVMCDPCALADDTPAELDLPPLPKDSWLLGEALAVLQGLGRVLGLVLSVGAACSQCGRRHTSHCGH